jgi:hypothetical protein
MRNGVRGVPAIGSIGLAAKGWPMAATLLRTGLARTWGCWAEGVDGRAAVWGMEPAAESP